MNLIYVRSRLFAVVFVMIAVFLIFALRGDQVSTKTNDSATPGGALVPNLSATKTGTLDPGAGGDLNGNGVVNPGDRLTYTVTINNTGADPATSVNLSDTIDTNTTFVAGSVIASPVAVNDAYTSIGNVGIVVPDGGNDLLGNDFDANNPGAPALIFAQINGAAFVSGAAVATTNGSVTVNSNGSFTYNPNPGFEGTDTFTYTLTNGTGLTDTATVSITVSGMIWFINNTAATCTTIAAGCGRLSNPFSTLAVFQAVNNGTGNNPATGDNIFIYESGTAYTGGVTLLNDQRLVGQDATSTLATLIGLTPPPFSNALPATNSGNGILTTLTNSGGVDITLNGAAGNDNRIYGLTLGASNTGVSGTNFVSLTARDVVISGAAQAVNLNAGTLDVIFGAVTVSNRTTTGLFMDSVSGTAQFGTTTISNTVNTGSGHGIRIEDSSAAVTFASANISNSNQTVAQTDADSNGFPENDGDGDAIFLKNNTGSFTLNGGTLINNEGDGIDIRTAQNLILSGVTINGVGAFVGTTGNAGGIGGHGIFAWNLSGTNTITNSTITNWEATATNALRWWLQGARTGTMTIKGTTFSNSGDGVTSPTVSGAILYRGDDTSNTMLTVGGSGAGEGCNFTNIYGEAIGHAAGNNAGSTATANLTIQNNNFTNTTVKGQNSISARNVEAGKATVNILGNTFDGVGRTQADTSGVIDLGTDALLAGNQTSFSVTGNTIKNIGDNITNSCGSLPCTGKRGIDVFIDDNGVVNGTILIDNNIITNVQRNGIIFDTGSAFNGSNFAAKITNNRVGIRADNTIDRVGIGTALSAGGESGIRIENRNQNAKALNILVSNNLIYNGNGAAGSGLNGSGMFFRTQNTATMSATVTGNTVNTNNSSTANALRADTNFNGGGTLCLDASSNTLNATGAHEISLNEILGVLNVEQASLAALSSANGGAVAQTDNGTPQFGVTCSTPPSFTKSALNEESTNNTEVSVENDLTKESSEILSEAVSEETLSTLPTKSIFSFDGARSYLATALNSIPKLDFLFITTVRAENTNVPLSGETVTKSLGTLPAGEQIVVQFKVIVDANIPTNDFSVANTANITATGGININSTTATTTVVHPPTVSKAFGSTNIAVNGTTSLTFTVGNANPSTALANVGFTDNLPAGLVVATPNGLVNNCGAGTITAAAGASVIPISGLTRAATTTCTITVNVTGTTDGIKNNTTTAISSTQGGTGLTSNTAVLSVIAAPSFTKAFGAGSIPLNGSTSLSFTITNNSAAFALSNISFNDNLPAGLVVATPPNQIGSCGSGTITANAGASSISLSGASLATSTNCTFSVNVTGNSAGVKNNSVSLSTTELGAGATANASVTVVAPPTITKAFSPTNILQNNGFSTLTIAITNPSTTVALTGTGVVDNFPAGMEVDATPTAINSCATGTFAPVTGATSVTISGATIPINSTCSFTVRVRGTSAGALLNTTQNATSTNGGNGLTASATLNVTNTATWTGGTSANWDVNTNWSPQVVPNSGNDADIPAGAIANNPTILASNITVNSLNENSARTLTISAGRALTVTNSCTINGAMNVAGAFSCGSLSGTGTVSFTGTAAQTIPALAYNNLTINNAAGASLSGNTTVNSVLTLTNGNINAGANTLTIGAAGSSTRTSGHVVGNLQKIFGAAGATFTFHVGTTGYSPATIVNIAGTGSFTVKANDGFLTGTDTAQSIQRNWSLISNGITQANITFQYLQTDVPAGANEANFKFIRRSGTNNTASAPTAIDTTNNIFTINGVTAFSDWTLGNNLAPTAASVDVGGQVVTAMGRGISKARLTLTDASGNVRYALTNPFGYYRFTNVAAGETYIISVSSKQYEFAQPTIVLQVYEGLSELNFVAK